ncbi:oocyte zinc finger protein XlCOF19-like [Amblyraja radiata]|uniref:oocyte zinc finger protein XlCOF19-like n=1 Tax=Amblyraja radiata TaxID=386614 RepID=UPI001401FAA0|nr:oocyte zinc finger protein XlCOF19-like [Amblyraja radiata]
MGDHMTGNNKEKRYECDVCGKAWWCPNELEAHRRVHSSERPFTCSDSGKGFKSYLNLKRHRCLHTGECPYTCSDCGKGFTRYNRPLEHRRTHTGESPYTCVQCGKGFPRPNQDMKQDVELGLVLILSQPSAWPPTGLQWRPNFISVLVLDPGPRLALIPAAAFLAPVTAPS